MERITKPDGSLEVRRHVGGSLAVHTLRYDTAGQRKGAATRYLLRDHLGGVHALVDLDGPVQAMAFGPWGQRRDASNWTALSGPAQASNSHTNITTRGFTAHEMLDAAGLVHMNGRLYDPELGRFLQADPFIQFLAQTQGHNRYSYVLNNPTSLTDPSGYFVGGVAILAAQVLATHLVHKHVLSQVPLLNAVANVLACAYGGAPGCINFAVHSAYARTGSFGAALEAGVLSAVSVAAFDAVGASAAVGYGSGDGFGRLAMNALANGVVGGIANELQGGRFGHGFMSAGVGALAKPGIRSAFGVKAKGAPHRIAARAAVGGTLTAATGGKFANGAVAGAFVGLFGERAKASRGEGGAPPTRSGFGTPKQADPNRKWANPTGGDVRSCDPRGCGSYGAARGHRVHQGTDYEAIPEQDVVAVTDGVVTKIGHPYWDDLSYRYVQIETPDGYLVRQLYVSPALEITDGANVFVGQSIGSYQGLGIRYPGITEHVHIEIRHNGSLLDPTNLISEP